MKQIDFLACFYQSPPVIVIINWAEIDLKYRKKILHLICKLSKDPFIVYHSIVPEIPISFEQRRTART